MNHADQAGRAALLREPLCEVLVRRLKPLQHDIARELPRLRDLSTRLLQHGEEYHPIAKRVLSLLELFPLIDWLEHGRGPGDAGDRLARLRWQLGLEEVVTSETFEELRELTGGYRVPEGACPTVRDLYRGLRQLEQSVQAELLLENSVLFPRALTMAGLAPKLAYA